jgi:CheY-like chemotaxis protein
MELMVYLLRAFGYTPLSAYDGEEGVRLAQAELPDLIICDVHLPKLDGYGVVAQLKQHPVLKTVPTLAVTALAMVGDRERLLEAGFDGYIGKPIEPDAFVEQLEVFLAPITAAAAASASASASASAAVAAAAPAQADPAPAAVTAATVTVAGAAPRPAAESPTAAADRAADQAAAAAAVRGRADVATILIVDDHVLNREFLLTLLGYGGHRLLEASDGAEALKMVHGERPDLVISDILMPNMDGYEFVTRMRADPATADVPIIFYTATYREREANLVAQACGVRWVLPKPSDPDVILRTVHEALGIEGEAGTAPVMAPEAPSEGRFRGIDNKVAEYLGELESSSALITQFAALGDTPEPGHEQLSVMTERLATSLSCLQAVSLRRTSAWPNTPASACLRTMPTN